MSYSESPVEGGRRRLRSVRRFCAGTALAAVALSGIVFGLAHHGWSARLESGQEPDALGWILAAALVTLVVFPAALLASGRAFSRLFEELEESRAGGDSPSRRADLDLVRRLVALIGHDFSNCVTAIHGFTRLAGRAETESGRRSALEGIDEASRQASGLCRLLLALGGRLATRREVEDLGRVCGEALRILERLLPDSIELESRMPGEAVLHSEVDAVQIQQLILCLAASSLEAMPDGGRIAIALDLEPDGEGGAASALLTVRDDGTAARGKGPTLGAGRSGLDYSIVEETVAVHRGELASREAPGGGTEVRVRLPACSPGAAVAGERPPVGEGRRVLVAENDRETRALVATILHGAGFVVEQVEDGLEALGAVRREPERYAAVILGCGLRGLDAVSCHRAIQEHRPGIPTVFVEDPARSVRSPAGAERTAVATKPFRAADLLDLIGQVLESH